MKLLRNKLNVLLCLMFCFVTATAIADNYNFNVYNASRYPFVSIKYTVHSGVGIDLLSFNQLVSPKQCQTITTSDPVLVDNYIMTTSYLTSIKFQDGNTMHVVYPSKGACSPALGANTVVVKITPKVPDPVADSDYQVFCAEANS